MATPHKCKRNALRIALVFTDWYHAHMKKPLSQRLWARFSHLGEEECWILGTGVSRYTTFRNEQGKTVMAHRASYEAAHGPVPDGTEINHTCQVTRCVNPRHLEALTHLENVRYSNPAHCPQGHPYDEKNTYTRTDVTGRMCRTCMRESTKRHNRNLRKRAACTCPCECGARS